jgi:hypothetical protein
MLEIIHQESICIIETDEDYKNQECLFPALLPTPVPQLLLAHWQ